jgi:hypothetical protein
VGDGGNVAVVVGGHETMVVTVPLMVYPALDKASES